MAENTWVTGVISPFFCRVMDQRPASEASNRQAFPAAWREVRQGQKMCRKSVLSVGDSKAVKSMYVFFCLKLHLVDIFVVCIGI